MARAVVVMSAGILLTGLNLFGCSDEHSGSRAEQPGTGAQTEAAQYASEQPAAPDENPGKKYRDTELFSDKSFTHKTSPIPAGKPITWRRLLSETSRYLECADYTAFGSHFYVLRLRGTGAFPRIWPSANDPLLYSDPSPGKCYFLADDFDHKELFANGQLEPLICDSWSFTMHTRPGGYYYHEAQCISRSPIALGAYTDIGIPGWKCADYAKFYLARSVLKNNLTGETKFAGDRCEFLASATKKVGYPVAGGVICSEYELVDRTTYPNVKGLIYLQQKPPHQILVTIGRCVDNTFERVPVGSLVSQTSGLSCIKNQSGYVLYDTEKPISLIEAAGSVASSKQVSIGPYKLQTPARVHSCQIDKEFSFNKFDGRGRRCQPLDAKSGQYSYVALENGRITFEVMEPFEDNSCAYDRKKLIERLGAAERTKAERDWDEFTPPRAAEYLVGTGQSTSISSVVSYAAPFTIKLPNELKSKKLAAEILTSVSFVLQGSEAGRHVPVELTGDTYTQSGEVASFRLYDGLKIAPGKYSHAGIFIDQVSFYELIKKISPPEISVVSVSNERIVLNVITPDAVSSTWSTKIEYKTPGEADWRYGGQEIWVKPGKNYLIRASYSTRFGQSPYAVVKVRSLTEPGRIDFYEPTVEEREPAIEDTFDIGTIIRHFAPNAVVKIRKEGGRWESVAEPEVSSIYTPSGPVSFYTIEGLTPDTSYFVHMSDPQESYEPRQFAFKTARELPMAMFDAPTRIDTSDTTLEMTLSAGYGGFAESFSLQRRLAGGRWEDLATNLRFPYGTDAPLAFGKTVEYRICAVKLTRRRCAEPAVVDVAPVQAFPKKVFKSVTIDSGKLVVDFSPVCPIDRRFAYDLSVTRPDGSERTYYHVVKSANDCTEDLSYVSISEGNYEVRLIRGGYGYQEISNPFVVKVP